MAPEPRQMDAIFIAIEVNEPHAGDAELAAKLEEVCPVDIYAADGEGGSVRVVAENVDECVLCGLCIEAAPPGGVVVRKLYDGTALS